MIKEFNTYLDGINSEMWKELCMKHGELRRFRKGDEFIRIGKVAKYIGFITKGSLKYIVYTTEDKEKVIGLETVGGFAASFPYCLKDIPSEWSVIVNTDSELYCISAEKIKELIREDSPSFLKQYRLLEICHGYGFACHCYLGVFCFAHKIVQNHRQVAVYVPENIAAQPFEK